MKFTCKSLNSFKIKQNIRPITKAIKATRPDQRIPSFFIKLSSRYSFCKIFYATKLSTFFTRSQNFFNRSSSNTFYRRHAKTNFFLIWHNRKLNEAFIHVRRQNFNSHMFTFIDLDRQTINIVPVTRHQRRHICLWIMRFKICCPICNQSITSSMRLIKTIVSKLFQLSPKLFSQRRIGTAMLNRTFNEVNLNLTHEIDFLFSNRFT